MKTKVIYDKIRSLVDNYLNYGNIYMEVLEDSSYTEKSLEEELIELFGKYNYTVDEFSIDIKTVFESPGLDIITIYIAYVDKEYGILEVIDDVLKRC